MGRAALHARAAPAAGAARARLAGAADRRALRRPRRTAWSRERPYELTAVFGVGFPVADRIARAQGVARRTRPRGRARAWCTCWPRPSATAPPACRSASWPRRRASCSAPARRASCWPAMAEHGDCSCSSRATATILWAYRAADRRARGGARRAGARPGRRARAAARAARRRPPRTSSPRPRRRTPCGRDDLAAVDRHRRPRHRQDGDDPDDLRRGRRAGARPCCSSRRPAAPRGG